MLPDRVCVVGAGQMGAGIAEVFARAGATVVLNDLTEELLQDGVAAIEASTARAVDRGKLDEEARKALLARVETTTELDKAAAGIGLAVEAVVEREDVKAEVFGTLDAHAPDDAVLTTNTSSISVTRLAAATDRPERFVGMHFFNPAPVMELVEVVRGERTGDEATLYVLETAKALGKTPVEVQDYPGFVSNRVLMPMINEACFCLMEGVADAEAIDTVMKLGMRHPMGPLELADFIGLDTCLHILEVLHDGLGDPRYRPCPLLKRKVAAGKLGKKSGEGFYVYD